MSSVKQTRTYLVLGLIFVIVFTHLPVVYTLFYHHLTGAPQAQDGNMDLTGVSLSRTVVLDGKWEFYWKRLIADDGKENRDPDFLIDVPGYWSRYKMDGKWLPADGYASYRLILHGLSHPHPVTVFIPDFGSAYRVYIDGMLAAGSGRVSHDPSSIHTVPRPQLYPVTLAESDTHEVVIEVATTRFSGLYKAPVLQDYNLAIQSDATRNGIRFILFGTVLSSFFILVVIYMLSFRNNRRAVWPPAMSFLIMLRIMLTSEFYSFWQDTVFFSLSYESTNALMFLVTFALNFLLIFLAQEQFRVFFSRKEKWSFFIYYTVIYLVYLLVPRDVYNRYLTVLLPVAVFALETHSFFKVYLNCHYLEKHGLIAYWGIILGISGLFIDCYYINGNIYPNMSLAMLILLSVCLMIQSLVSALRIAGVYRDLAVSSYQLEMAKNQIAMQKEYYDAISLQINEIRGIKHDMRHFVGAIRRLCDEGSYRELNAFLAEYSEKTDTEPLPHYCENVVANSILGYYALKSREAGIPFRCACSIPKHLSMSDIDLCIVLGNALENAIEACAALDNPNARFISSEVRTMDNQLLIKIENAYDGSLDIRNGHYHSTKDAKARGMGMQNIRKVAEANGGFVKTKHDGKVFTLMAAFPCTVMQTSDI